MNRQESAQFVARRKLRRQANTTLHSLVVLVRLLFNTEDPDKSLNPNFVSH